MLRFLYFVLPTRLPDPKMSISRNLILPPPALISAVVGGILVYQNVNTFVPFRRQQIDIREKTPHFREKYAGNVEKVTKEKVTDIC